MERYGRFGLIVVLLASAAILVFVGPCANTSTSVTAPGNTQTQETAKVLSRLFTTTELAKYDGRNGQPAYVAVDGFVYDVTGGTHWVNGVHSVCEEDSTAGQDLTSALNQSPPNMRLLLQEVPRGRAVPVDTGCAA